MKTKQDERRKDVDAFDYPHVIRTAHHPGNFCEGSPAGTGLRDQSRQVTGPVTNDRKGFLGQGRDHQLAHLAGPDRLEGICQLGYAPLSIDQIPGIREITVTAKIGSAPGGGDTGAITITLTQIARADTSRTTVNST